MEGRVALVTGAAGGIGGAIARGLASNGATVVAVDRDAPVELTAALGKGAVAIACDLADSSAASVLVDRSVRMTGRIDMLVNVAGAMIYKPIEDHGADDWQGLMALNLIAPALLIGAALRHMPPGSAIVNVASVHARRTSPLVSSYAASKAALVSLTRSTAIEARERGIRCNAVLPGAIDTRMLRDSPNIRSGAEVIDPIDIGEPDDIAALTMFLLADAARFITGADIVADGGRMGRL